VSGRRARGTAPGIPTLVLTVTLALALAGAGCGASSQPSIHDAYVIAPAASSATMYFTITNPTGQTVSLTSVATPLSDRVEMHTESEADGLLSMTPVTAIAVDAKASVTLDPGGSHVMLMDVASLTTGAHVPTTFTFSNGHTQTVSVPVRSSAFVPGG
jgi:copper(I)-binding protein